MEIEFSKKSVKAINRMDFPTKQRIRAVINSLPDGDVKRLTGKINTLRLRAGDWRILFSYVEANKILIEKIAHVGKFTRRYKYVDSSKN